MRKIADRQLQVFIWENASKDVSLVVIQWRNSGRDWTSKRSRHPIGGRLVKVSKGHWKLFGRWGFRGRAKSPFDHGGFGGSLEAPPNGDWTATRSLVHVGSMPIMHHISAYLKILQCNIWSLARPWGMQRENGSVSLAKIGPGQKNGTFCITGHILPSS